MSLPRYGSYRHSGVEWLGDVPSHWEVCPLKVLSSVNDEALPETTDGDFQMEYVDIGSVSLGAGIEKTEAFTFETAPSRARRIVRHGDVIVSTVRTYLKSIAPILSPAENLVVSTGFAVVRPNSTLDSGFAKFALQCSYFVDEVIARSTGVSYPAINATDLARIRLPAPPILEQTFIASFLDSEIAKIDALISEQEKLISLLAEKRQATISHAVTKGLNPNASMKDSGVEWLGEVPEHWRVVPLMRLTNSSRPIMYGIVLPGVSVESGIPIVKGGDVKPARLKVELLNRTTKEIELPFARARLRPLDIVYSIRGTIGDAEVVPDELLDANITQDVARISPANGIQTWWLIHVMKSKPIFVQLAQRSLGAAVPGINIRELKRAMIPVPPAEEREELAIFLDAEIGRLNALANEASRGIALLKERRSALISAAVTGKIDVRQAAQQEQITIQEAA